MSDEMNLGVEEQEVAEPVETGVEEQEVAEPVVETPKETKSDSAFAEYRRRAEAAEKELAELKAGNAARQRTLDRLTGTENGEVSILAEAMGIDAEDIAATIEAETSLEMKDLEIKNLKEQMNKIEAERMLQEDLAEVQKLDGNIKDLSELGEVFLELKTKGVDTQAAYWAAKAQKEATKMKAPVPPGKANTEPAEKNYFTEAEVNAMTSEQKYANADKILASLSRWSK